MAVTKTGQKLCDQFQPKPKPNLLAISPTSCTSCGLEADRISFSFYFSAPENAFFYFSAEKDIRIFVFFSFFRY